MREYKRQETIKEFKMKKIYKQIGKEIVWKNIDIVQLSNDFTNNGMVTFNQLNNLLNILEHKNWPHKLDFFQKSV